MDLLCTIYAQCSVLAVLSGSTFNVKSDGREYTPNRIYPFFVCWCFLASPTSLIADTRQRFRMVPSGMKNTLNFASATVARLSSISNFTLFALLLRINIMLVRCFCNIGTKNGKRWEARENEREIKKERGRVGGENEMISVFNLNRLLLFTIYLRISRNLPVNLRPHSSIIYFSLGAALCEMHRHSSNLCNHWLHLDVCFQWALLRKPICGRRQLVLCAVCAVCLYGTLPPGASMQRKLDSPTRNGWFCCGQGHCSFQMKSGSVDADAASGWWPVCVFIRICFICHCRLDYCAINILIEIVPQIRIACKIISVFCLLSLPASFPASRPLRFAGCAGVELKCGAHRHALMHVLHTCIRADTSNEMDVNIIWQLTQFNIHVFSPAALNAAHFFVLSRFPTVTHTFPCLMRTEDANRRGMRIIIRSKNVSINFATENRALVFHFTAGGCGSKKSKVMKIKCDAEIRCVHERTRARYIDYSFRNSETFFCVRYWVYVRGINYRVHRIWWGYGKSWRPPFSGNVNTVMSWDEPQSNFGSGSFGTLPCARKASNGISSRGPQAKNNWVYYGEAIIIIPFLRTYWFPLCTHGVACLTKLFRRLPNASIQIQWMEYHQKWYRNWHWQTANHWPKAQENGLSMRSNGRLSHACAIADRQHV